MWHVVKWFHYQMKNKSRIGVTILFVYVFLSMCSLSLWNSSDEFIFGWNVPRIQKFNFWEKLCVFCNQRFVKRMLWVLFPYVHLLHCTSTWQIVLRLRYTIWNTSFHSTKCTNRVHCLIYLCIRCENLLVENYLCYDFTK